MPLREPGLPLRMREVEAPDRQPHASGAVAWGGAALSTLNTPHSTFVRLTGLAPSAAHYTPQTRMPIFLADTNISLFMTSTP